MTSDDLQAMFDKHDDDRGEFKHIPVADRLHPSRRLCAYLKVASLMEKPAKFDVHAEHDVVYIADANELNDLTDADVIYLIRCGVHYDSEGECLAHFC